MNMKAETTTYMKQFVLTTIGTLAIILSQAGSSWAAEAGAGTVEFRSARFTGSLCVGGFVAGM